jgi:hypothetical protein
MGIMNSTAESILLSRLCLMRRSNDGASKSFRVLEFSNSHERVLPRLHSLLILLQAVRCQQLHMPIV